jgi:hypothetical protein
MYKWSFYFQNPHQFILNAFTLLFLFILPIFYQYFKNRKIDGKHFLATENNFVGTGVSFFPLLGFQLANFWKEDLLQNNHWTLPFCALWVLAFLFLIAGIHIADKTVSNIKKQYQLT